MARILLGAATLAAGGGIAQVARLSARLMREAGHQVTIISYLDREASPGTLTACGSKARFAALVQLHAITADLCIYDSAGLARAHPLWLNRPSMIWMHGTEVWEALKPSAHRALQRAKIALTVSENTLRRHEALHGPLENAKLCPLATEQDAPATRSLCDGPPTVLILGRIDAAENYKGHDQLIAAWPQVHEAVPDARLVIAGSGSGLGALRQLAATSPAAHAFNILGFVPDCDLEALWHRASVFAMPSRAEGFGLVYIEAMRQGIPVIASVHDGAQEVNIDGVTGFNVDLSHKSQLTERLISLLSDEALRKKMGDAGRDRWSKHFRPSNLASRLLPLITLAVRPNED